MRSNFNGLWAATNRGMKFKGSHIQQTKDLLVGYFVQN